ncbi:MAG: hypothetical protein ABIR15_17590 [Chitinophagaceae bacterium]
MAKFITRIKLLSADEKDYEILNREIEKEPSVLKTKNLFVTANKIKKGEYNYRGNITLQDVADVVYRAIKKTGRDYTFTIMKNKGNYNPDSN